MPGDSLTLRQAAERMSISYGRALIEAQLGTLEATQVRRVWKVTPAAVDRWLEERQVVPLHRHERVGLKGRPRPRAVSSANVPSRLVSRRELGSSGDRSPH